MELTYREENGVMIPNLVMPEQPQEEVTRYGLMRLDYLKARRKGLYTILLTKGEMTEHLLEIQHEAERQYEKLMKEMAAREGITEELKAQDPMKWVGLMNNLKHSVEEILRETVICC